MRRVKNCGRPVHVLVLNRPCRVASPRILYYVRLGDRHLPTQGLCTAPPVEVAVHRLCVGRRVNRMFCTSLTLTASIKGMCRGPKGIIFALWLWKDVYAS